MAERVSLRAALVAFQGGVTIDDFNDAPTDAEIASGLRAAFDAAGIAYDDDTLFLHGSLTTPEEIEAARLAEVKRDEDRARWRAENPKEAALEDRFRKMLGQSEATTRQMMISNLLNLQFASAPPSQENA